MKLTESFDAAEAENGDARRVEQMSWSGRKRHALRVHRLHGYKEVLSETLILIGIVDPRLMFAGGENVTSNFCQ